MGELDLFSHSIRRPDAAAIVADEGTFTFEDLAAATNRVGSALLGSQDDLGEARVAVLVPPGYRCSALMLGIWAAGGIAVPLATSHPASELGYVLEDSDASVIIASREFREVLTPAASSRGVPVLDADDLVFGSHAGRAMPDVETLRAALILYTSGSTGKPKGVVWTHGMIDAQIRMLSKAWRWARTDRALLVLPLHHVHGLLNVLSSAIWNGATCEILPAFDAAATLDRLASGEVSVFMAVPTIYRRLISEWETLDVQNQARVTVALSRLRLMISGSAALPITTLDRWREISGHTLLERYGMTEIGMALSNPYDGPRVPGSVGTPFREIDVRLVDDDGNGVATGEQGEIEVRGPTVFRDYWRRPEASVNAFRDGWFRTGDIAVVEDSIYRILGRQSVDIIKSGGEKISALEVEEVLRRHPSIEDCAVIGVPDEDWGERVAVAIVLTADAIPDLNEMRSFARETLAPYKLPRQLLILDTLPRNAMGKVVKPLLKDLFDPDSKDLT